jgi:hypothetical protein
VARKYGQRGYQEEERPQHREGPAAPRPPQDRLRPDRPAGRGLGAPSAERFRCAVCGAQQAAPAAEEAAAACASCGRALHTCTHCRHFDTAARFECRQALERRVAGKASANECTLYTARVTVEHDAEKPAPGDARAAFDALFKL